MVRTHANCKLCPLSSRRKVWSEHPPEATLMLLGEAPGQEEDTLGKPFVGASGRLLNWALGQVGLHRAALWITNVISCRPPNNEIDSLEGSDAILACKPGFIEELESAYASGVRVILALGLTASRSLGLSGALRDIRGSVYQYALPSGKHFLVIPTYHPSAIMRQHWKRTGGGTADDGVLWLADFRKARSLSENGFTPHAENFITMPVLADVERFVSGAIARKSLIAVDTETTGLNPDYAKVVVIGLADSPNSAISIPILDQGGKHYWSDAQWPRVFELLNMLFQTCDQVYQNCFFDVPFLRKAGFTVPSERIAHDTLLIHHTISPELRHDLATIVSLYGATPFWKSDFRDRKVTILQMDQLVMRKYNLRDCVVLHQVLQPMLRELQDLQLLDFYKAEVQPLIAPLLEMTETGIMLDTTALNRFRTRLETETARLRKELLSTMQLPDSFNLDSDDHLRYFLYGHEPTAFKHLTELPKKRPGTKIYKELSDLAEVREKATPIVIIPGWKPPSTSSGKPAVDKEGLLAFRIQLNNRLAELKGPGETQKIRKLLDWLQKLDEYTRLQKLLSTYGDYKAGVDGRIRPRWIATGTVSGRLACRSPNLQNVPKARDDRDDPAAMIRDFFIAAPGHVLISCDYVNLEAQLLAYETLDPILCEVFEKGLNLHDLNTKAMFHIDENSPRWKSARRAAKIFFFGGISYGGGDYTIYQKVYLEAPELELTFAEFKKAKDSWMAEHPEYVKWKLQLTRQVLSTRMVRTEFGRLRQFLGNDKEIVKEALDFKIQSAGASLVNRAMARIYRRLKEERYRARFVLQIHDQLVIEAPVEEAEKVQAIMVEEMEKPFMFKGYLRKVPVESCIGTSFGQV